VHFSGPVTVSNGTPTLLLSNGAVATYQASPDPSTLVFNYTVGSNSSENTNQLAAAAISLNGATITNLLGAAVDVAHAVEHFVSGILQVITGVFVPTALFTAGNDVVDFNHLKQAQADALAGGADIYHGLGGSDTVTLPDKAYYNVSAGNGVTLGWSDSDASTFYTGSQSGDTYTVNGGDGSYHIVEGDGLSLSP
jgi:hypothetical protein